MCHFSKFSEDNFIHELSRIDWVRDVSRVRHCVLLDAENIDRRVQLVAEKKLNVYANHKRQEKTASHDMQICVL